MSAGNRRASASRLGGRAGVAGARSGQILAIDEIARGQHAQVVSPLRGRAGQGAQAAALLAQAYEKAGDVDAAVATFQEADWAFSDPGLAWAAVVALFRDGRHDDADRAVTGLLASAGPAWDPGRNAFIR